MRALLAVLPVVFVACTPFEATNAPESSGVYAQADLDPTALRLVAYNIESVGEPDEPQYAALRDVLVRLQADVLALSEIASTADARNLDTLADELGYPYVVHGERAYFGGDRLAVMSRLPLEAFGVALSEDVGSEAHIGWTSAALSGDEDALDVSRAIVAARVQLPTGATVGVVPAHWKSGGTTNAVEFRRAVDAIRSLQALDAFGATDHLVLAGDLNVDIFDNTPVPAVFDSMPSGIPSRYVLGDDLFAAMQTDGLLNHPHLMLEQYGLAWAEATQTSGSYGTRPSSGRVLDYVYHDPALQLLATEVYNSVLDDNSSGVDKFGEPLDVFASMAAADHLPIIADFTIAGAPTPTVLDVGTLMPGDLQITELLADPVQCSDWVGEWIEVVNVSGFPVDLTGVEVMDASGYAGALGPLTVSNGQRFVLARSADVCNATPDGVYGSSPSLNNGGDGIGLIGTAGAIDWVEYGADGALPGASWRRDADGDWCSGFPTPGASNPPC